LSSSLAERLSSLRQALAQAGLDGFILPANDEFMGEYVPASARRLEWLTGFTGSAGMAAILPEHAAFFTDGRYTLQAERQVTGFALYNSAETHPETWLAEMAGEASCIGYDPFLHTPHMLEKWEQAAPHLCWRALSPNPLDALWKDRPAAPAGRARPHPLKHAGEESLPKRRRMGKALQALRAEALVVTEPDVLCWLLNLRGDDVPYTPFLLCYGLLHADGLMQVFLDETRIDAETLAHCGEGVTIHPPEKLEAGMRTLAGKRVLCDPKATPIWFHQTLIQAGAQIVAEPNPCILAKALKNPVEREGMRFAHRRDGLAVTRFLAWIALHGTPHGKKGLDEIRVAEKLASFRAADPACLGPSFATISGSGPHGAIVHYQATQASNRPLANDAILLLDSGGQYAEGTTDITRTIAIGAPTEAMKRHFTLVLKGHIALADVIFPHGTTGAALDVLARRALWRDRLDYDHGTGHGVGSYLSVHEGPQRIGKRAEESAPLLPGMVVSNEPGYYRAEAYGIRIESLVLVVEKGAGEHNKPWYGFETLTLAPIDRRLIDPSLLSEDEKAWLDRYHARVYEAHQASLDEEARGWLAEATAPFQ
jgi:Xaa-Pro aminopeptidase